VIPPAADTLYGERLQLRRFVPADQEPFARLNADPQVMRYFPAALSATESRAFQQAIDTHFAERGFGFWVVSPRSSTELLGLVGLSVVTFAAPFTPCVEIGWRLDRAHWGQGLARESALLCLAFAFEQLELDEVVAFTTVTNERSERLMQRLGMQTAGDFLHPALTGHPLQRHLLYRMQRKLWRAGS